MRNGKIARLPVTVRDQLNQRLEDSEPAATVLPWLNALPEVRQVLDRDFAGKPVTDDNLTHWRQGGFCDWQRAQRASHHARRLLEQAALLDQESQSHALSDRFALVIGTEFFACVQQLLDTCADDQERLAVLRDTLRDLRSLRREDHQAARLRIEQDRWERLRSREDREQREREISKVKGRTIGSILDKISTTPLLAQALGGTAAAKTIAETIHHIKFLQPDDLPAPPADNPA